jgi:DNA polymerase-3 subunit gamma/tau
VNKNSSAQHFCGGFMSYLVLARKWRPQGFDDLIGQEHVCQTLMNSITSGRVHHAFLFTGARGVGKTSAARIFAKALNCQHGPTIHPCGVCPSCIEITSGQGIDVLEIDGASNTGVDDIRELRENIRYLPSQSNYKIFIIDEVHMLSINAFNALLKTLEEPPEHVKFIFATTEPHKIPITILSRCQRFDFRKISQQQVQERLRYIVDQEQVEISDLSLSLIARNGGGSMRDALSALDQAIAFCGNKIGDSELQALLGLVSRRLLLDTVEAVLERDARQALALIQKVDDHGHSFRQFCQQLVEVVRALLIIKLVDQPGDLVALSEAELQDLEPLVASADVDDLQRTLATLIKAEADLASSSFPRLTFEMVLVKLATLPPGISVATLIKRLESLEKQLSSGGLAKLSPGVPEKTAPPPPEPPPPQEEFSGKKSEALPATVSGDKSWAGLVEFVKSRRRPLISSLLEQTSPLQIALPRLQIGVPSKFYSLADGDMCKAIETLAAEYYATDVRVDVKKVTKETDVPLSLHAAKAKKKTLAREEMQKIATEHPLVKAALQIFGGSIENIKPVDKDSVQQL